MRVVNAKIIANRVNEIDIKFSNGMRDFVANIKKDKITLEDIKNNTVNVKVYSMIRNCCAASPIYVLESNKSKEGDIEISELLVRLLDIIGNDIKKIL